MPWPTAHKLIAQCSKVSPVVELFCENVQYVEFPINVGGLDFPEMDTFYDVVIMYSDVFHPFCCEVF